MDMLMNNKSMPNGLVSGSAPVELGDYGKKLMKMAENEPQYSNPKGPRARIYDMNNFNQN
eukprot:CAMPEP_0176340220 /NCGR_PEP_ID=MMETSP0126-20121128/1395_1 /TAXON_ID=141414 ORGANISM="Strombidinopsis acuminatum, Strain SPMC142" /NCGR_SAMPLE_ID=MMETSP0126 /ASSEMBLY_ACC=CAM_ASM_000229 /LENGTH=59 /DNA_ID=CAMNT_0017684289 /DNA_START=938 /DNA_END=1120 /DNA_ORIENTATION=+